MLFLLMQIFYYVIFRFFNQLLILHLNFCCYSTVYYFWRCMLEHTKRQVKVFFPAFKNEKRLYFLMFITAVCFLFLLICFCCCCCYFFSGGGGQALLGGRVKGQISRVIPAMVTSKWDWRQSSQSKNRTSYKPYTSPIFGKTSQSKGYLRLRSRNLVFFSPCLFFFNFFFPKGDRPCLHTCFDGFLSKMVWKWMTTNLPFTRLRIIQEYQLELKERNERLENR